MGQHPHTADAGQQRHRLLRFQLLPLHVSRSVAAQVLQESLSRLFDIALLHHGQGNMRPTDRSVSGNRLDSLPLQVDPQGGQLFHHGPAPLHPALPKPPQDLLKLHNIVLHEVAQQVNLITRDVGAQLNAGNNPQIGELLGRPVSFSQSLGGVMVRDGSHFNALAGH